MDLLEIKLENPIGKDEVIRLRSELIKAKKHDFLIVDTGVHDFTSKEVKKYFRKQLADLAPCLTKFQKRALVYSLSTKKKRKKSKLYKKFVSKEEAINWFEEDYRDKD